MKKRVIGVLTAAAMVLSLTACGGQSAARNTDSVVQTTDGVAAAEPNTSYTGTVSAISTQSITVSTDGGDVTIGLTENTTYSREFGMGVQQPGDMWEIPSDMGEVPGGMGQGSDGINELPADGETPSDMEDRPEGMEGEAVPGRPGGADSGAAGQGGTPPELPEGEANPNDIPNMDPNGAMSRDPNDIPTMDTNDIMSMDPMNTQTQSATISDVSVGAAVVVVTDETGAAASVTISGGDMGGMQQPGAMGQMPGGMGSGVDSYAAATEFTADAEESGVQYSSTAKDENALHVYQGAAVTIGEASIVRRSADSTGGDNSSFYGIGAAALVTDGTLTISGSTITTDAPGGAGVFAYGNGTAYVMDTVIDTAESTSGGIHVAGGGTLYAWDLTVETEGESSAAIRSDRGSGTMVVDGGTYVSNGVGSPAVYSAADITVHQASLTATGSEAVCIEGLNSIRLFDCDLSGNMEDLSQNDCTWNVILYQSMSGDSEVGNSTFEMVGGTLKAGNGGMFYTTNTESTFILSGVDITYAEDSEFFLKCTGNANQRGWGTAGSNGADCRFTAIGQEMQGDLVWDSISRLDFYILEGSTLTGAAVKDETYAGDGGDGYAAVYIDADSTWIVTGDCTLTRLYCAGTVVDTEGSTVTIAGTDGTVYVQGGGRYTITVEGYDSGADVSGASTVDSWSEFQVARP